jgi:hypothetical protein
VSGSLFDYRRALSALLGRLPLMRLRNTPQDDSAVTSFAGYLIIEKIPLPRLNDL